MTRHAIKKEIEKLVLEYDECYYSCRVIQDTIDNLESELLAIREDKLLDNAGVTWCND